MKVAPKVKNRPCPVNNSKKLAMVKTRRIDSPLTFKNTELQVKSISARAQTAGSLLNDT